MSSPTHDSGQLVEELLGRWFDAIEAGEPISLDDLCAEHPELRPRIERLVELESEVLGDHASPENRGGPRPVPAERIGDFVLHRWIGGGGMGDVYVATQEPLGRPVALKVLRQHLAGSPTRRERFRREARITASLEHPNIVPVFEAGEADGFLFLAMRLLKGQTLSERTTPWKPRELAAAVLPVARALQVAHEFGVVHRDLKPSNIFLTREGVPYLLDFGLARGLKDVSLTAEGTAPGTLAFMAPEQLSGSETRLRPQVDIYALAATLHTCLTGRPIFESATPESLIHQVLMRDAPRLDEVDGAGDLGPVLERALEKRPEDRFASMEEFADELERVADGRDVRTRSRSRTSRVIRRLRRDRRTYWVLGLIVVLSSVFGGLEFQRHRREQQRIERAERERVERIQRIEQNAALLVRGQRFSAAFSLLSSTADEDLSPGLASTLERVEAELLLRRLWSELISDRGLYAPEDFRDLKDRLKEAPAVVRDRPDAEFALALSDLVLGRTPAEVAASLPSGSRTRAILESDREGGQASVPEIQAKDMADALGSAALALILELPVERVREESDRAYEVRDGGLPGVDRIRSVVDVIRLSRRKDYESAELLARSLPIGEEGGARLHELRARIASVRRDWPEVQEQIEQAHRWNQRLGLEPSLKLIVLELDHAIATQDEERFRGTLASALGRFGPSEWLQLAEVRWNAEVMQEVGDLSLLDELARSAKSDYVRLRAQTMFVGLESIRLLNAAKRREVTRSELEELRLRIESVIPLAILSSEPRFEANLEFRRAVTLSQLGEPGLARVAAKRAVELNPTSEHALAEFLKNVVSEVAHRTEQGQPATAQQGAEHVWALQAVDQYFLQVVEPTDRQHRRVFEIAVTAALMAEEVGDRERVERNIERASAIDGWRRDRPRLRRRPDRYAQSLDDLVLKYR